MYRAWIEKERETHTHTMKNDPHDCGYTQSQNTLTHTHTHTKSVYKLIDFILILLNWSDYLVTKRSAML